MKTAPLWSWAVALWVGLGVLSAGAALVYGTSWEGDRANLEEHRALFFAQALARVDAQEGDYAAQRFAEFLGGKGVQEAFVIVDGGVDDFGISRGQSYAVNADPAQRNKRLDELQAADPKHRARADRGSRASSGATEPREPGRAWPGFVLERDGDLQSAQVPLTRANPDTQKEEVVGSAGASLPQTVPSAPIPWALLLGLALGGGALGAALLYALRAKLEGSWRVGAAVCALWLVGAAATAGLVARDYEASLTPYAEQRVKDAGLLQEAAAYAQMKPEPTAALVEASDIQVSGEPRYAWPQAPYTAAALVERRFGAASSILWASLLALAALLSALHRLLAQVVERCRTQPHAYFYVAPSMAGMMLLVFVPFTVGVGLSVFDNDARRYYFVGLQNFTEILLGAPGSQVKFYWTLFSTVLWTVTNIILHVSIGLGLALLLKDPMLRFKKVYRVLLVIPWAIPNYITALIWKGMFNKEFGAVNQILGVVQGWLGMTPSGVDWLGGSFGSAFAANLITNTWLGFPFMMVVSLGALQSIPTELYEAADMDGATRWQQFRHITLPLLKPALFPAIILGTIWTFNMFNVIYLVSGGGPNNSTEILITDAYRAFAVLNRHGLAAAYSVIIFLILFVYTIMTNRVTKATEGAFD